MEMDEFRFKLEIALLRHNDACISPDEGLAFWIYEFIQNFKTLQICEFFQKILNFPKL